MENKTAEEQIKENYVSSWHKPQKDMNFNLSDLDGTNGQAYGDKDRDGIILLNGQIKTFTDYHGKIRRGKIYHNINNMWWVIASEYERFNIGSFHFFDDTLKEKILRHIPRIKISISVRFGNHTSTKGGNC